jgi:hypothetical protein
MYFRDELIVYYLILYLWLLLEGASFVSSDFVLFISVHCHQHLIAYYFVVCCNNYISDWTLMVMHYVINYVIEHDGKVFI